MFLVFLPGAADPMPVVGVARAMTGSLAAGFEIDGVRLACASDVGPVQEIVPLTAVTGV